MLKHATPRSSPSLGSNSSHSSRTTDCPPQLLPLRVASDVTLDTQIKRFNERSIDCEGITTTGPLQKKIITTVGFSSLLADKFLGFGNGVGIGPVITHGRAIVRRGLSFNDKKDADSISVRSVKSEGKNSETGTNNLPPKSQSTLAIPTTEQETNNKVKFDLRSKETDSNVLVKEPIKSSPIESKSIHKENLGDKKGFPPSLKSLLRLPGVYGHIPVPENAPPNSPHIVSPDSLSLTSSNSFRSSNSGRTSSRSWTSNTSSASNNTSHSSQSNCSSSSEPAALTTLKIYAKCLRSDIEYKTLSVGPKTTCGELINLLLSKVRMRHRDPNLFYLTMEVFVRKWSEMPVRALLVLEEGARPAQLALCRPSGDLRFALQMRRGGVVKIHDTVLMPGSQYKSLLISYRTTAEEVVQLLLNCYSRKDSKHYFALHEVRKYPDYRDRRLGYVERPLEVKAEWPKDRTAEFVFVLRRNMTQALSLRKLFLKTSEVLKEHEEQTKRRNHCKIKKNKFIRAEPGIVIPEEATLIDCTTTTPTMTTFRENEALKTTDPGSRIINPEPQTLISRAKIMTSESVSQKPEIETLHADTKSLSSENKAIHRKISIFSQRNGIANSLNKLLKPETRALNNEIRTSVCEYKNLNVGIDSTGTPQHKKNVPLSNLESKNPKHDNKEKKSSELDVKFPKLGITKLSLGNIISNISSVNGDSEKRLHLQNKNQPQETTKAHPENIENKTQNAQNISKTTTPKILNVLLKDPTSKGTVQNERIATIIRDKSKLTDLTKWKLPNQTNLTFSIGAQTELTFISVNGPKTNTPKWNSVETLIESTSNFKKCENFNGKTDLKLKHCEYNCKKCFYI